MGIYCIFTRFIGSVWFRSCYGRDMDWLNRAASADDNIYQQLFVWPDNLKIPVNSICVQLFKAHRLANRCSDFMIANPTTRTWHCRCTYTHVYRLVSLVKMFGNGIIRVVKSVNFLARGLDWWLVVVLRDARTTRRADEVVVRLLGVRQEQ